MHKVFGIRHHGPGSAKSLKKALQQMEPDCLLIESPNDAEAVIDYVANEGLKPPVAILIYNPKDLSRASYLPFAEFSPEWQAMKYGLKKEIPIRFMDLPMSFNFALDLQEQENIQLSFESPEEISKEDRAFRKDPMAHIAKLAGYADSERWWEVTFEQQENEEEIFQSILELMAALRAEAPKESKRTLQREAFMRKTIRKAVKDGFQRIAIVCGAWHGPVLDKWAHHKQSTDNAILKGIKKLSTKSTWIPWSYDRLTFQSGYGAGVISPAWYELLFSNRKEVVIRWMAKVARLFRKKDLDASSAHVIEAVRLSETLATLRNLSISGISELREAAVSIFCEGDETQLKIIEDKLIVGEKVGKVPTEIPVIPLQQDLQKLIKSCRLTKYWGLSEEHWLKATANDSTGGLDLREPNDRLKSLLLHRLNIIKIPWGKRHIEKNRFGVVKGNFKEKWKLKWKPDFAIRIIEAGSWGNTVYEASVQLVQKKSNDVEQLPELTEILEMALNADLTDAIDGLIQKLENLSALTKDVFYLMDALPSLVNIVRYGNTRQTDMQAVEQVVHQILPRIFIGLPGACTALDEDAANEIFKKLLATNLSIGILNQEDYNNSWYDCLNRISKMSTINGILAGACVRILFDKGLFDTQSTGDQMNYALSKGNKTIEAALWLEGFLHGSGLLLIHNHSLWNILDEWVSQLKMEDFKDILPLLRRTFSNFPGTEREKMMKLAKQGKMEKQKVETKDDLDWERAEQVIPTVQVLLGIE